MKIWYMRDNHTFRQLSVDVEEALTAIREEFQEGYTHGSLCCRDVPNGYLAAHGDAEKFEAGIREWYASNVTEQNA